MLASFRNPKTLLTGKGCKRVFQWWTLDMILRGQNNRLKVHVVLSMVGHRRDAMVGLCDIPDDCVLCLYVQCTGRSGLFPFYDFFRPFSVLVLLSAVGCVIADPTLFAWSFWYDCWLLVWNLYMGQIVQGSEVCHMRVSLAAESRHLVSADSNGNHMTTIVLFSDCKSICSSYICTSRACDIICSENRAIRADRESDRIIKTALVGCTFFIRYSCSSNRLLHLFWFGQWSHPCKNRTKFT